MTPIEISDELQECLTRLVDRPLAFVHWAYQWGVGELKDEDGPDVWQRDALLLLEESLRSSDTAAQIAIASGHGIGKGALVSWVNQWAMATRPHLQGVLTANTQSQLFTKTWRELAKWHRLMRPELKQLFTWTGTRYYHNLAPETWYVAAIPWSERTTEAFQGAHDTHVIMTFDESSAIPDPIWEASDGSMTTPRAIRLATGNPTRTQGRFRECFPGGRFSHRWKSMQIDSRTCKKTNKAQLQQWVDDYGEESDYVKVRVRGLFPSSSVLQFIGEDIVRKAQSRQPLPQLIHLAPRILGVDIARTGANATVLTLRQGPVILWKQEFRDLTLDQVEDVIAHAIDTHKPDGTICDAAGLGAGPVDNLINRRHYPDIIRVYGTEAAQSTAKQQDKPDIMVRYHNLRTEMWGKMREWLDTMGCIDPSDTELAAQLQAPEFSYDSKYRVQLESKEDMLKRNVASPDHADSLALTFAKTVYPKGTQYSGGGQAGSAQGPGSPFSRMGQRPNAPQGTRPMVINPFSRV